MRGNDHLVFVRKQSCIVGDLFGMPLSCRDGGCADAEQFVDSVEAYRVAAYDSCWVPGFVSPGLLVFLGSPHERLQVLSALLCRQAVHIPVHRREGVNACMMGQSTRHTSLIGAAGFSRDVGRLGAMPSHERSDDRETSASWVRSLRISIPKDNSVQRIRPACGVDFLGGELSEALKFFAAEFLSGHNLAGVHIAALLGQGYLLFTRLALCTDILPRPREGLGEVRL